jgi:hypothetical protein
MKQYSARFPLYFGLVFIVCAISACKTISEIEVPRAYKVAGIDGDARYFEGRSETPRKLKGGDLILQGTALQTASGPGNAVMLVSDEAVIPANRNNQGRYDLLDKVIVHENSVLKISKLAMKTVGKRQITDTRLVLSAGSAFFDVGLTWPTDVDSVWKPGRPGPPIKSIRPQPNASYFEIEISNMVVHAEHAVFFASRGGVIRVLDGAVALEFPGAGTTKNVFSGQEYDSVTGGINEFAGLRPDWGIPYWNWLRPRITPPPPYQVPQRPF